MSLPLRLRSLAPSVRRLRAHGWAESAISRAYQISSDDVRSILDAPAPVPTRPSPIRSLIAAKVRQAIADGRSAEAIAEALGLDVADVADFIARVTRRDGKGLRRVVRSRKDQARPPRPAPLPRPRELVEWSKHRGPEYIDDDAPELVPTMPPPAVEPGPPAAAPAMIADDWGSPHAAGRDDDDLAEDFEQPQPAIAPAETATKPHRWKEPRRKSRAWRDD